MKVRVRVDFDIQVDTYEDLKLKVYKIMDNCMVGNAVIQSPLCQEDMDDGNITHKE